MFDDEFAKHIELYGDEAITREVIEADHADALQKGRRPIVRFYIPQEYAWRKIRNHGADGSLGEFLTTTMRDVARLNPDLLDLPKPLGNSSLSTS